MSVKTITRNFLAACEKADITKPRFSKVNTSKRNVTRQFLKSLIAICKFLKNNSNGKFLLLMG